MGRPPLNVKPIVIRLSVETIARIDTVAGKHRRSQFLREAAEAELSRREASHGKPKPKLGLEASHDKPKPKVRK